MQTFNSTRGLTEERHGVVVQELAHSSGQCVEEQGLHPHAMILLPNMCVESQKHRVNINHLSRMPEMGLEKKNRAIYIKNQNIGFPNLPDC